MTRPQCIAKVAHGKGRVCDVLFVGRLSYCFEESQAVGGCGLGGFMLCQVWEVLLQV